jgi:hypothetical protein
MQRSDFDLSFPARLRRRNDMSGRPDLKHFGAMQHSEARRSLAARTPLRSGCAMI